MVENSPMSLVVRLCSWLAAMPLIWVAFSAPTWVWFSSEKLVVLKAPTCRAESPWIWVSLRRSRAPPWTKPLIWVAVRPLTCVEVIAANLVTSRLLSAVNSKPPTWVALSTPIAVSLSSVAS